MEIQSISQGMPLSASPVNQRFPTSPHSKSGVFSRGRKTLHTVLIADDSLTERTFLAQILNEAGYEVLSVNSGNEALVYAEEHQPDLIMLDIIMPDGDGYRTCRQLKRSEKTKKIPIIMVSSKTNDVDRQWALKLGADGYVVKPYTAEDIFQEIAKL